MAGVESRLLGVEKSLERADEAIVRVHERVDDLATKIGDIAKDFDQKIDRAFLDHEKDEERMINSRMELIDEKLDRLSDASAERGQAVERMNKLILSVIIGAGSLAITAGGWIMAFIIDKGPAIIRALDKLESIR